MSAEMEEEKVYGRALEKYCHHKLSAVYNFAGGLIIISNYN